MQDTLNYIWFRKDIVEGYLNLQVYTIKIDSINEFNGDNIIKYRTKKDDSLYLEIKKACIW